MAQKRCAKISVTQPAPGYNTATSDVESASGLALGAGIGYRLFDLDFAWVPFGILGNTFRYTAHVKF